MIKHKRPMIFGRFVYINIYGCFMEFNVKLQELRKQKGLTQEELAENLYVSRTAVSKWESGRGYPNIESLKAIAKFFEVTVDELLSSGEVLNIAEKESKEKANKICNLVYSLLDIGVLLFFFLPLFGQNLGDEISEVSLFSLALAEPFVKYLYFAFVIASVIWGVFSLAAESLNQVFKFKSQNIVSLIIGVFGVMLFIISPQPYAAAFCFVFLIIKVVLMLKHR